LRIYIDLWVRKLDEKTRDLLEKLGYRAVVVEETGGVDTGGLVVVKKKIIETSSREELRRALHGVKSEKCVVSVKPLSVTVARAATHDSRVDTIIIDPYTYKYIDINQINMMKEYCKPLELPFNTWFYSEPSTRSMIYRRVITYLLRTKLPLIISSSASSYNEVLVPASILSYLNILFGIDKREGLLYLTTYPREILVKNGVSI